MVFQLFQPCFKTLSEMLNYSDDAGQTFTASNFNENFSSAFLLIMRSLADLGHIVFFILKILLELC